MCRAYPEEGGVLWPHFHLCDCDGEVGHHTSSLFPLMQCSRLRVTCACLASWIDGMPPIVISHRRSNHLPYFDMTVATPGPLEIMRRITFIGDKQVRWLVCADLQPAQTRRLRISAHTPQVPSVPDSAVPHHSAKNLESPGAFEG